MPWRLLRSGAATPIENMATDEALWRSSEPRPALRLYAWSPPALSLGWFQPREAFVDRAARAGVQIVRRPTGGGAIHHDDELTFCLVARAGEAGYPADTSAAYRAVHAVVAEALAALGAELTPRGGDAPLSVSPRAATLCFEDTTAFDLVDDEGRKVVGSAQRRDGTRVLHHGSIPLQVPALSPASGSVSLAARRAVTWSEAADRVTEAFARWLGPLEATEPTPDERQASQDLAHHMAVDPARRQRR